MACKTICINRLASSVFAKLMDTGILVSSGCDFVFPWRTIVMSPLSTSLRQVDLADSHEILTPKLHRR